MEEDRNVHGDRTRRGWELPRSVIITDVVTRDGLQDEERIVPTEQKVRIIEGLLRAGVRSIEVTSFVHPRVVPQMADAEALVAALPRLPGVTYSALVPNRKGAERALAAGVDEIRMVVSASESHNRTNLNRPVAETLDELRAVCRLAAQRRPDVTLAGTVATAFACPFEGRTPLERLLWVVDELHAMGVRRIGLADTTGMANPRQVYETVSVVRERFPDVTFWLHLHNTRDLALANALAGLQAGIRHFDSSLGGLGGCPFAPGATGNVSTEDLVHMLHEMGIETGIDLDALFAVGRLLRDAVGHDLDSAVAKAGKASDLHPLDCARVADSRTR